MLVGLNLTFKEIYELKNNENAKDDSCVVGGLDVALGNKCCMWE